jgi:hypothetical protein
VVHPVGEQEIQGLVRDSLGDLRESRPSEDHPAALVAGAAELCLLDEHETSPVPKAESEGTADRVGQAGATAPKRRVRIV